MTPSPKKLARWAGALYLITIVGGIIGEGVISGRLIDADNAATTATNIVAHESLYRLGFTVYLVEMAAQIATTVLLYALLQRVNKPVALLAMTFGLVGCTIKTFARVFYFAPLLVLGGSPYLDTFTPDQLHSLALLLVKVNHQGAALALALFGFETLLEGYLIVRSTFLPRWLGWIAIACGLGWLSFLWPPLGYQLFPIIALLGILGSLATIGWLLVRGVDEERWRATA